MNVHTHTHTHTHAHTHTHTQDLAEMIAENAERLVNTKVSHVPALLYSLICTPCMYTLYALYVGLVHRP